MLCVASTHGGQLNLAVKSAIQPVNSRTGASFPGTSEIQQINIGAPVTYEHQVRDRVDNFYVLIFSRRRHQILSKKLIMKELSCYFLF